jgi:purine nucleosidase
LYEARLTAASLAFSRQREHGQQPQGSTNMNLRRITKIVLVLLVVNATVCLAQPPKVIVDTDFNAIGDDGQVGAMAAQLYAQGVIDLLGFTIPSGNQWRDQEVSDCLKAIERMGIENRVKVYIGSQSPLVHDYQAYLYEEQLFGTAIDYVGAYTAPRPDPNHLVAPPDGFATHTRPAKEDAIDFIIQSIHRYPNEVSILAIGPLTNIAIAVRKDPSIIPLLTYSRFLLTTTIILCCHSPFSDPIDPDRKNDKRPDRNL